METQAKWPRGIVFPEEHDMENGVFSVNEVARAIQCWSVFQDRERVTVREAGDAFNLDDDQVRQAVEAHYWMFLDGPDDDPTKQTIEHEGE